MERWTCPKCNRVFGRKNQSHLLCEDAPTLEQYFDTAKPWERPIFEVVQAHFVSNGDELMVDPLPIGILLKNGPMFAELRSKAKWTAVGSHLPQRLSTGRLSKKVVTTGKKFFHVINVSDPDQIDDELLDWLTDAFHFAAGTTRTDATSTGMAPDDIDDELL